MAWVALVGGFVLFMALIWGVFALDLCAARRYGYRPFALPNLAFMLIPHIVLAVGLSEFGPWGQPLIDVAAPAGAFWVLGALGLVAVVFMMLVLSRRTNIWIGIVATTLMVMGASVLVFSVFFRELADTPSGTNP